MTSIWYRLARRRLRPAILATKTALALRQNARVVRTSYGYFVT
jgi:hypothetical protein